MKSVIKFAVILAVLAPLAAAQSVLPSDPQTIDMVTSVTKYIDKLIMMRGDIFVGIAQRVLTPIEICCVIRYSIEMAAVQLGHHHGHFDVYKFIRMVSVCVFAQFCLTYYNSPIPLFGESVHQILPDIARELAGYVDISSINTLVKQLNSIYYDMEQPSVFNPAMFVVYLGVLGFMVLAQLAIYCVNVIAFVALGLGTVVGPLIISVFPLQTFAPMFWEWFGFMLKAAFFRLTSSILVYIFANAIVDFFSGHINGDYSLAHFFILLPGMVVLVSAMVLSFLKAPQWTAELFGKVSGVAGAYAEMAGGAVRGAFTRKQQSGNVVQMQNRGDKAA